jgi:2,5-diamino-6-(ribosylamino)-4(3H)-pyrimidinone 5'-phosphate reductase
MDILSDGGIGSIMIEGGGEVIASAFRAGLVDELYTYIAPEIVGGRDAPTVVDGPGFSDEFVELDRVSIQPIDDGVLVQWSVTGD